MKKTKWKALFMTLCLLLSCLLCACTPTEEPVQPSRTPDGLTVVNAKLMKGDEAFYGAGVNFFSMFTSIFSRKWDTSTSLHALEVLKEYDCKVIRFSTLPFYAEQMGYYFEVEQIYWEKLDELVAKAEELELGLLPSLFWTFGIFDYYHEPYEEALLDENSQSMKFIREYTEKFVTRYRESPAIYGWEFSNEKVLSSDLPGDVGKDEHYTLTGLNNVYRVFAETVRKFDPYGRMISTGDTNPRESQYNQWKFNSWTRDTREQHEEVMRTINPAGIDTVSQHQYSLRTTLTPGDKTSTFFDTTTWKSFFEYLIEISSSMGKACYVGEVGYGVDAALGYENVTLEAVTECYQAAADAAFETGMQLILFWNYDPLTTPTSEGLIFSRGTGVEFSYNENMPLGQMVLETMKALNRRFEETK